MLNILKDRLVALEIELEEQEISKADEDEIELKVAEYKQKLINDLKALRDEKAKTLKAKIEEVNNLIEAVEKLQAEDKIESGEEEKPLPNEAVGVGFYR